MSDRVILPLVGIGTLVLDGETYRRGLEAGSALSQPGAQPSDEPLMDAEQLAAVLHLPQTWLEQAARDGRVPCVKAGRWVRFRRSAVEAALAKS